MARQPLLQAELLRSIGHAMESMLDLPATDAALSQAAVRYQRLGKLREAAALTVDRAALRLGSAWEVPVASDLQGQAEALYPAHADDEEFSARHAIVRSYAERQTPCWDWHRASRGRRGRGPARTTPGSRFGCPRGGPVLREAMCAQAPTFVRILTLRAELVAAAPGSAPDMQRIEFFI